MVALRQLVVVWDRDAEDRRSAMRGLANVCEAASAIAWLVGDRADEGGAIQFANADSWLHDPSTWYDFEEDPPKRPRRKNMEQQAANGHSTKPGPVIAALVASKDITALEIADETGIARHNITYHLKRLVSEKEITATRDGKVFIYSAAVPQVVPEMPADTGDRGEHVAAIKKLRDKHAPAATTMPAPVAAPAPAPEPTPISSAPTVEWEAKLRFLAQWEGKSVDAFVDELLDAYRESRK